MAVVRRVSGDPCRIVHSVYKPFAILIQFVSYNPAVHAFTFCLTLMIADYNPLDVGAIEILKSHYTFILHYLTWYMT